MPETDLALEGLEDDEVMAVLGGLCTFQFQALSAGAISKVNAAGNALRKLAEQNPDAVRRAFLENRDAFQVAAMPDDMLDELDLEVQGGRLQRPADGDCAYGVTDD